MYSFERKLTRVIIVAIFSINVTGEHMKNESLIYILMWTRDIPFIKFGFGQEPFIDNKCTFQNCFLINDHEYFSSYLDYEVIMFNAPNVARSVPTLPSERNPSQRYILVSLEPSAFFPLHPKYNGAFNLTFTYRLSSDIVLPYIIIKDQYGQIVGPKKDMHWMSMNDMNETSNKVKEKLKNKRFAVAWVVSHCNSIRLYFVEDIMKELVLYGHQVHVYGDCGEYNCTNTEECFAQIELDYYFYLAFENSFDEDYVTEKLLNAVHYYTVPVVCGGANYTRFMPKGAYINAHALGVQKTARKMVQIINDKERYYNYFRWHGYYTYNQTELDNFTRELCALCDFLHENANRTSVYEHITSWWSTPFQAYPGGRLDAVPDEVKFEEPGIVGFAKTVYNYFFGD